MTVFKSKRQDYYKDPIVFIDIAEAEKSRKMKSFQNVNNFHHRKKNKTIQSESAENLNNFVKIPQSHSMLKESHDSLIH